MSAAAALRAAAEAGVSAAVEDGNLVLEAPTPPPANILDALKRHKADVVTQLDRLHCRAIALPSGLTKGRAALLRAPPGIPQEWADGVDELGTAARPDGFDRERWNKVVDDAYLLLRDYGAVAAFFGWNTLDLFGCHPTEPDTRVDCKGIALLMRGGEVVSLDRISAHIRMPSGALLTHLRHAHHGSVPLWQIVADAGSRSASEIQRRSWTVAEAIEHARRIRAGSGGAP